MKIPTQEDYKKEIRRINTLIHQENISREQATAIQPILLRNSVLLHKLFDEVLIQQEIEVVENILILVYNILNPDWRKNISSSETTRDTPHEGKS